MAAARHYFKYYIGFPRKFATTFSCQCRNYWSSANLKTQQLFLASQWFSRIWQSPRYALSYSNTVSVCLRTASSGPVGILNSSSRYKMKTVNGGMNRTIKTSKNTDDHEFFSEKISIPVEHNLEDLDIMTRKINDKTGVLAKVSRKTDEKKQWTILLGGTRQEVQNAVSFLKSLLNPQKQRLTPDSQPEKEKHFGDKEKPIWAYYRRNFKGQKPPMKTRKRCIRGKGEKQSVSGNPCPLCRLYLAGGYELDYKDIDLLFQFISPHTGEVFEASKTGLCKLQQERMVKAIETAKDYGLLPYSIPGPRSLVQPPEVAQIPRNVRLK